MLLSEKKTKSMIINFSNNNKFITRLELNGSNIEIVNKMKILGTTITDTLSWDDNCQEIISKVNQRMLLLKGTYAFGATKKEMVHLWILYCRSVLEQSAVLWSSSLTQQNIEDLERTQKSFVKLICPNNEAYEQNLLKLNLQTLEQRRKYLCLKFAKDNIKNDKLRDIFPENKNPNKMKTRHQEAYKVIYSNTNRLKNSSIIDMQHLLNDDHENTK